MPQRLDPKFDVLPVAQQQIWNDLSAAPRLGFVLYGGTAIALHLGHRRSIDFDFFRSEPLDKHQVRAEFAFVREAAVLQDTPDTLVVLAEMPAGLVKISFFGSMGFGRVNDPLLTRDGVLLVASLDDLMATMLKATLDRAEAKDYRDIAELISAGVSLSVGLSAFRQMFNGEPAQVLRAIGYFKDGDLNTLSQADQQLLRSARDGVDLLDVRLKSRSLASLISYFAAKKYAAPTSDPKPVAPHKTFPRAYAAKVLRPDFDRPVAATFDKPVEATPAV